MGTSGNPAKKAAAKTAAAARPLTFDHLQSKKKPITRNVYVHLDSEISEAFDEVDGRYDSMVSDHRERRLQAAAKPQGLTAGLEAALQDEMEVMQKEWDAANEALQETTVVVRMKSPGRKKYEALLLEHPATDEQNEKHNKDHGSNAPYNAETFGAALVSLCAVEPVMTEEQAQQLIDEWNLNEAMLLFTGALEVCHASQVSNLGKGTGRTSGSTRS